MDVKNAALCDLSHIRARKCNMTIYMNSNEAEIIQSACKLPVSPHRSQQFSKCWQQ